MMFEEWGDSVRRAVYAGKVRLQVARSNSEIERAFGVATGPTPAQIGMTVGLMGGATLIAMFFLMSSAGLTSTGDTSVAMTRPVVSEPVSLPPVVAPTPVEPTDLLSTPPEKPETASSPFVGVDLNRLPEIPYAIPQPDPNALYTIMVDKSRKELLVLEETRENFHVVDRFPVSLGPKPGDKYEEGDMATPEGLYQILSIKEGEGLPGRYGPRAYVLNYPNKVDRAVGKSGYGIWIHGSGLGLATDDTEGCVEVNDENVVKLGTYINSGTPVYIFPEGFEAPITNGAIQKQLIRPETVYGLKEFRNTQVARLVTER